jgi:ABC-type uncharacterized transport system auxiliary subunit
VERHTRPGDIHRAAAAVVAALCIATVLAGCAAPPAAPPTYHLPDRPARPGEQVLDGVTATEGDTAFRLIGLTTGLKSVLGSHAEWPAKGQFVRIRLVVTNTGRTTVPFDTDRQLLLTSDSATHVPDSQAMLIKRQPVRIDIGAADLLEFDLYYDVPVDVRPTGLRAFGGPTLADFSDTTGVDIPVHAGP